MTAIACSRCGRKDFSVDPMTGGLCELCKRPPVKPKDDE